MGGWSLTYNIEWLEEEVEQKYQGQIECQEQVKEGYSNQWPNKAVIVSKDRSKRKQGDYRRNGQNEKSFTEIDGEKNKKD